MRFAWIGILAPLVLAACADETPVVVNTPDDADSGTAVVVPEDDADAVIVEPEANDSPAVITPDYDDDDTVVVDPD